MAQMILIKNYCLPSKNKNSTLLLTIVLHFTHVSCSIIISKMMLLLTLTIFRGKSTTINVKHNLEFLILIDYCKMSLYGRAFKAWREDSSVCTIVTKCMTVLFRLSRHNIID